ncbi:hypothetical protein M011DRAFT_528426 [Sporormia fimetaria CBS 119925]|uniref:Uncharacterized protein n=1 Tax=Sporormia fimetaria CBS 119925 TaxID=1340428 RepID=A0A6A6V3B1_9PLEO|nr:hypothetical protein M011DRAFT_528426 [Sporormia fimetaria CBS 119925]
MLCGGGIDKESVKTYRALRTLPNQECLMHHDPVFEDGWIQVGSVRSSRFRCIGSLPGLYLIHRCCIKMIRIAAGIDQPTVSLLALVSILGPTAPTHTPVKRLTKLDGDILSTIFDPHRPSLQSRPSPLQERLNKVAPEILSMILSYCEAEYALAMTVGLPQSYLTDVLRDDITRQRVVVGVQATRLLHEQPHCELYTEKTLKMSSRMTAIFVNLGGETYLQDLREEIGTMTRHSEGYMRVTLDIPPHGLALQVDHLGVRNIAFHFTKSTPMWLRDEVRCAKIFMDRWNSEEPFPSLCIVSDALKVRMIDFAARNSPHPRPLLSPRIGKSAMPYSVKTVTAPYLPIPGYFEPFYIDLSASVSVYLEYGPGGGITGVFEHQKEGRKEIYLGKPQKRSVKIYGLRLTGPCHIAFVQFKTDEGSFQPAISTVGAHSVIEVQEHHEVRGMWWGEKDLYFYCNVVF